MRHAATFQFKDASLVVVAQSRLQQATATPSVPLGGRPGRPVIMRSLYKLWSPGEDLNLALPAPRLACLKPRGLSLPVCSRACRYRHAGQG